MMKYFEKELLEKKLFLEKKTLQTFNIQTKQKLTYIHINKKQVINTKNL